MGGKSRALGYILPRIPYNCAVCASFIGGGAVELSLARRGQRVYAYDSLRPLVNFWRYAIADAPALADEATRHYPLSRDTFRQAQKTILGVDDDWEQAVWYYLINRASFSGLTLSGGMKSGSGLTLTGIDHLRHFNAVGLTVAQADFTESIPAHLDAFLYCDPPYKLNCANLYGKHGDAHRNFDHEELARLLLARSDWLLSYNDCPAIRELYAGCKIISVSWKYGGIRAKRASNEVLIFPPNGPKTTLQGERPYD